MKGLMNGIRGQLLRTEMADQVSGRVTVNAVATFHQNSSDEEEDKMKVKRTSPRGLPLCSVSVLSSWYQEQHPAGEVA